MAFELGNLLKAAPSVASILGGIFGDDEEYSPGGQRTLSAYESLPPEARTLYEQQFFPALQQWFQSQQSQAHPFQQKALGELGGSVEDISSGLGRYMNPYKQYVTNQTNESYKGAGRQLNAALGKQAGGRANRSILQLLGQQNENERLQALERTNYDAYTQALGLRRQTLADMLNAGNQLQQQPVQRLGNFASLLGMLPGGQHHETFGPTYSPPNAFDRFGGFATGLNQIYQKGGLSFIPGLTPPAQQQGPSGSIYAPLRNNYGGY